MSRKTLISNYTVENKGPYDNGDYGLDLFFVNYAGMRLVAGYKF